MLYVDVQEAAIRLFMKKHQVRKLCREVLQHKGLAWKPHGSREWRIAEIACTPHDSAVCGTCGKPW